MSAGSLLGVGCPAEAQVSSKSGSQGARRAEAATPEDAGRRPTRAAGALLGAHHPQRQVDTTDALDGLEGRGDVAGDGVLERAAGDRQQDGHVDDALVAALGPEEGHLEFAAVALEFAHHRFGEVVGEGSKLRIGWNDVVDGRERPIWKSDTPVTST